MRLSPSLLDAVGKYLSGQAGADEEKLVNDWYYSFDDERVEMPDPEIGELRARVRARIWSRLNESITEEEAETATLVSAASDYRRWLLAAASIIVLFLAGRTIFLSHTQPQKSTIPAESKVTVIKPGGNKAILTLSDGTNVVLDSVQNGLVADQGVVKVRKTGSGQLVYDPLSPASDPKGNKSSSPACHDTAVGYNTITTPRGGQFQVTLPDGTIVWLNAASSLRYPTRFEGARRMVELTGEAYFEVKANAARPFMVEMPGHMTGPDTMHIEVLGTDFNVNSYGDESIVKTTLVQGSVKIFNGQNSRLLLPGQQSQSGDGGPISVVKNADVEEALAWKNGLFQYSSTNLQTIMRQIARWYDVRIVYEGKLGDEFFSGSMPRTENVTQVLNMLAMTNTVHFTIKDKDIYVRP